jgi:hypothetical protein
VWVPIEPLAEGPARALQPVRPELG